MLFTRSILTGILGSFMVSSAVAAPTVLQIGSPLNAGSFAEDYLKEFESRIEAALPEKVDVQIFMSNALGVELDVYEGMQLGTHAAQLTATPLANVNPRVAIWELPFLFQDRDQVAAFLDSPAGDMLRQGMDGTGMEMVAVWDGGFRVITNAEKPVTTPADLSGLKIRVPNSPFRVDVFEALGANPTPLSFSELYTALDQGVVDGQENPAQIVLSARFAEVQAHLSVSNHVYVPTHLVIADWFLDNLDEETRSTLVNIAQEMAPWTREQGAKSEQASLDELAEDMSIDQIDFQAFQDAVQPLYSDPSFVEAIGADMIEATRNAIDGSK